MKPLYYWIVFIETLLISISLFTIPTFLIGVMKLLVGKEARRMALCFILFLYSLDAVLVLAMFGRVMRTLIWAQIAVYGFAAMLSIWLCFLVLRPTFIEYIKRLLEHKDRR